MPVVKIIRKRSLVPCILIKKVKILYQQLIPEYLETFGLSFLSTVADKCRVLEVPSVAALLVFSSQKLMKKRPSFKSAKS